jgi:hypothetical protein
MNVSAKELCILSQYGFCCKEIAFIDIGILFQ